MENSGSNKQVVLMAFGLPIITAVIVIGSMYAGHVLTIRSDRPTNVLVNSTAPKVDVNVPQAAPPNIEVSAPPAAVNVQVPQQAAPQVTVNTPPFPQFPPMPAPNITVNPAAPIVTIIDRRDEKDSRTASLPAEKTPVVASATPVDKADVKALAAEPKPEAKLVPGSEPKKEVPPPVKSTGDAAKPLDAMKPADSKPAEKLSSSLSEFRDAKPVLVSVASAAAGTSQELSLETLYACANRYIDTYCRKNGLDAASESRKWNRMWKAGVDQAISDNIDSSEQSYINRIVIAKRDYFNIDKATPEKTVEACRILLRYRDGQLAWLEAMKEALTQDNLKKTVAFLSAGPK